MTGAIFQIPHRSWTILNELTSCRTILGLWRFNALPLDWLQVSSTSCFQICLSQSQWFRQLFKPSPIQFPHIWMIRNIWTTCKKSITYHIIIIHCVAADVSASSQHHPTSIPGTVMPMVKGTPTRSMLPSETDTLQCQAATRATQTQKLRIYRYIHMWSLLEFGPNLGVWFYRD